MDRRETVHYSMGVNPAFDQQVMSWVNAMKAKVRSGAHPPHEFVSLDLLLHDMRLYKTAAEIKMMKHAAQTAVRSHERAMKICEPDLNEGQLDAEFLHEFKWNGMVPAYTTIVGGGENACVLHYIENNQPLVDGDLVLIDAGAEYGCYASDITRTFPVNGKFSEAQRLIYQIVLDAQYAAINAAQPGNNWNAPHEAAVQVISQGLLDLGILKGTLEGVIEEEAYKEFFMHKTGHWLGMDVHDVGDYKIDDEWRVLEQGMVLTVEPGIYISPIIAGGGMVGASLAAALSDLRLNIALIEASPAELAQQSGYDDRAIALSYGSSQILKGIGVWKDVAEAANPIDSIHVSDRGHFGATRLNAQQQKVPALGYLIQAQTYGQVVNRYLEGSNVRVIQPAKIDAVETSDATQNISVMSESGIETIQTKLLVACDGGNSAIRKMSGISATTHDYEQVAIIANVSTEVPHENRAFERFTEQGPIALLPMSDNRCSLVWTLETQANY